MTVLNNSKSPWILPSFTMSQHTEESEYDTGVKGKRLPGPEVTSPRRPPCPFPLLIYNPSIAPIWKALPEGTTEVNAVFPPFSSHPPTPTIQPISQLKKPSSLLAPLPCYPSLTALWSAVLLCELHSLEAEDSPRTFPPFSSALGTILEDAF